MRRERAVELLVAHAGALNDPSGDPDLTPEEEAYLRPLMGLAERLKRVMVPVEPSADFVRNLGQELVGAARRQQSAAKRLRRAIIIGAAALGSALSVAGVVVLILLRRRGHAQAGSASS
ncbi:MAG: hypothetical protein PVH62_02975 [Anaerolineae bacterium]|jgi:hypothetical protein